MSCHQFHPRPCNQCLHQSQVLATSKFQRRRQFSPNKRTIAGFPPDKIPTALSEVQWVCAPRVALPSCPERCDPKSAIFWMRVSTTFSPFWNLQNPSKFNHSLVQHVRLQQLSCCFGFHHFDLKISTQGMITLQCPPPPQELRLMVLWVQSPCWQEVQHRLATQKCSSNAKPWCEISFVPACLVFSSSQQLRDKNKCKKISCVMIPKFHDVPVCSSACVVWTRALHFIVAKCGFQCCMLSFRTGRCLNS